MAKRGNLYHRRFRPRKSPPRRTTPPPKFPSAIILESGTLAQLQADKDYSQRLCAYHWGIYSELAIQRSQIANQISAALSKGTIENYQFDNWQRVVKYKYSLMPLSTSGSLKSGGGRFNIGDIDSNRFPMFPALYLAANKETGLQEVLGQEANLNGLTPIEIALTNSQSISLLSVSGNLESVLI